MKKVLSIIALVLAMTMMMTVSSFAAAGFYNIGTANVENVTVTAQKADGTAATATEVDIITSETDNVNETFYADSDRLSVTAPATAGAYYGVLLVEGSALPTAESEILYIDQKTADGETVTFAVLPILPTNTGDVKLFVSSNAADATLVEVPLNYAIDGEYAPIQTAPEYTLGDVVADGIVNISDVTAVLNAYLGNATLDATQTLAADVVVDNIINISDVTLVLNVYLGNATL